MDHRLAFRNLVDIRDVLEAHGLHPWLTDGTLLGFHREKKILDHDIDTDFGMEATELTPDIPVWLQEKGFALCHSLGRPDLGFEYAFVRDNIRTDIFFFYEDNGKFYHAAWLGSEKGLNMIKYVYDPFFPLQRVTFLGEDFWAPGDIEKYVLTKYGPDWRTPKTQWDWAFSPVNHVRTDIWL